jgi:hypothetical protein
MTTALVTITSHDLDHVTGGKILPPAPGTGPLPLPAPWSQTNNSKPTTGPTKGQPQPPSMPLL